MLLNETKRQSYHYTGHSTDKCYHPAFEHEYAAYLAIVGSKVAQRHGIFFLFDNQHRQRTYYVETCHHQNEGEEYV